MTGANFAGFDEYSFEDLIDIGFGIAEVERDGTCVITKHEGRAGFVTEDTVSCYVCCLLGFLKVTDRCICDQVKCQFLYELQGDVYLNSDVKALLNDVRVERIGKDRYVSSQFSVSLS